MNNTKFVPRPYQKLITDAQLSVPRVNVWAGMGLGKTVSTLTAIDALLMSGLQSGPALVLAPLRVAQSTWPDEAAKWPHLRGLELQPVTGSLKSREAALRNTNASVFTINYENVAWLVETLGDNWPFGTVIADESTKLKNFRLKHGGKRAAALGKIAHSRVHRWVNLTGTPSPRGLVDLWGQCWFIDAGNRLGRTYSAYISRWFTSHQRPGQTWPDLSPRDFAQSQITDVLRDVTLSLDTADWFDNTQPVNVVVPVSLPPRARRHYRDMERKLFTELATATVSATSVAVAAIKCLQIASGALYTEDNNAWETLHDEKVQALDSIISEAAGAPVLVAYHWRHDLERLQRAFPSGRVLDTDPQTLRDWNAGKIPVMFAHPASAGHGLNLQDGGNILVFFSHWWDLEHAQQITERIGPARQAQAGHPRPVFVYHILATDTIDTLVAERLRSKRSVQDLLLEAMKTKNYGGNL